MERVMRVMVFNKGLDHPINRPLRENARVRFA